MGSGSPAPLIADLPDRAVAESCERVRAGLDSIGLVLSPEWTTVDLWLASLANEGAVSRDKI